MPEKPSPGIFDLMTMGVATALMIAAGLALGLGLDDWLGSSPWGVIGGLCLGVTGAVGSTVRQVRKFL